MIKKYFSLDHNTPINYSHEIIGGLTNFMAIAYIIIVNPSILNAAGKGFPIHASITATILTIIIMTTLASFIIKLPFVIAPGMGMNALISYTLILHDKLSVNQALGVIFWSSALLFIFSITRLRQKIVNAIPESIQLALSVGIGLFLILIGIKNANIISSNPDTLLALNKINLSILLCFFGFTLASILFIRKKIYALILPIIVVTILNLIFVKSHGTNTLPQNIFTMPDFSLFMQIDWLGSLKPSFISAILSLFIVNFFDATSSVIGLLTQLDYKNSELKQTYYKRALITDALGGAVSGVMGTSPGAVFVESSAGIQNGARTGLASLITALLCIPFLFLAPLIAIIPAEATAPILILVGMLMMNNLKKINLKNLEDFIAVILTIIMMPLCFSITAGAVFGIMSYTIFKLLLGKYEQINFNLIIVSICCIAWFIN